MVSMVGVRGKEEVRKSIEMVSAGVNQSGEREGVMVSMTGVKGNEEAEAMGSVEMVSVGVEEVKGVGVKSVEMVSVGVKTGKEVGANQSGARERVMVKMFGVRGKDEAEATKSVKKRG